MKDIEIIKALEGIATPFWFYDMDLFGQTLEAVKSAAAKHDIKIHFAMKANVDRRILGILAAQGFGADCVSGNEVRLALECGIAPEKILYAGVGKTNKELREALAAGCHFNCESLQEIYVLNIIASQLGKTADISVRINPDVDGHTAKSTTSGTYSTKFGIAKHDFDECIELVKNCGNLRFNGLQFHIGSQIKDVENVFGELCQKANETVEHFEKGGLKVNDINLGGGLGIDYRNPQDHPIADFDLWLETISSHLVRRPDQTVRVEPGRSIIAQCCSLYSRILFVKHGEKSDFIILDAGMNNLIRPALYGSYHKIENVSAAAYRKAFPEKSTYDIVGPVCESSDTWGKNRMMPVSMRGDIMAIRSAGAYGQSMSSSYNLRDFAQVVYSDQIYLAQKDQDWF